MLRFTTPALAGIAFIVAAAAGGCSSKAESPVYAGSDLTTDDLPVKIDRDKVVAGTFDQAIDHPAAAAVPGAPDAAPLGTFKQRYWYTSQFADGPTSPVLFNFCGEAECSDHYLDFVSDVAKVLHASIVALEHRYYGPSKPFEDLTLEHMKYLTVHNALEDAATFETYAKASLPLSGKWIAVGGSYSGMLSAFYRLKHPEAVVGAWASSAPVNITRFFDGYDRIVSHSLGPTCTLLFQQAMDEAGVAFDDPVKRDALSKALLGAPWDPSMGNKRDFQAMLSGFAQGDAQYGHQANLCEALVQHELSPIDGLVAYASPPIAPDPADADGGGADGGASSGPAVPGVKAPPGVIPALLPGHARRAPDGAPATFDDMQWYYQECTELGLFAEANSDRTESVMVSGDDEQAEIDTCVQFTGTSSDTSAARAEYYQPLLDGRASNVFFVNGTLDPWSSLGFTDPETPPPGGNTVFMVQQGSHCTDLSQLKATSFLGDFEARAKVVGLMRTWLTP
jgi:hypothetical protein